MSKASRTAVNSAIEMHERNLAAAKADLAAARTPSEVAKHMNIITATRKRLNAAYARLN